MVVIMRLFHQISSLWIHWFTLFSIKYSIQAEKIYGATYCFKWSSCLRLQSPIPKWKDFFIDEQNKNLLKRFSVSTNSLFFDHHLYGGSWMWFISSNSCYHPMEWFSEGKKTKSKESRNYKQREHKVRTKTLVDESTCSDSASDYFSIFTLSLYWENFFFFLTFVWINFIVKSHSFCFFIFILGPPPHSNSNS